MARCAKDLLQIIVGARQVFDLVALKEPLPIACGDFPEVCHRWSERAKLLLLLGHSLEQLLIGLLEGCHVALFGVGKQVSGLMDPGVSLLDRRPQRLCRRQSCSHEPLEAGRCVGKPLFSATWLIPSHMASRRSRTSRPP